MKRASVRQEVGAGVRLCTAMLGLALAAAGTTLMAAETIDPWTGTVTMVETDLALRAGAMRLDLQRVYRSGENAGGMLGPGWRLTLEKRLVRNDAGLQIQEASGIVVFTQTGSAGTYSGSPGEQVTLTPGGGAIRTRVDEASEAYDADGRLSEIRRPDGGVIKLQYDSGRRLARAGGPGGNALRFNADPTGRLVRVDSSTEVTTSYRYAGGRLTEVQVNGGPVTRYAYDGQGRLVRIDEPRSGVRELAYDGQGRVVQRRFADGAAERYEYDDAVHVVRLTDPSGGVTSMRRSADRSQEEITDAIGRRTVIRYDDSGRMLSVTAGNGLVANYSYDALGRVVSAGMPGFGTRLEYVGDTQTVAATTFSDGSRQTLEYDANRNLIALREGTATVGAFTYDPNGQVASVKELGEPERRYTYYPDGCLKSEAEVGGRSWQFEYDRHGNVLKETDGAGHVTVFTYDAQDRLVAVTDPAGAATRYAYDDGGRVTQVTDPVGRVTRFEYDVCGRLKSRQDAAGRATQYRWDGAGRLTSAVRPGGATTSYVYDRAGNLLREVNPVGGVTRYTYDAAGQLASVTDPEGGTWKYEYSMPGQVSKIIAPGGLVKEITYDARRRRSGMVDAAGRVARVERDGHGRVTKALLPGGISEAMSYDSAGRVAQESSSTAGSVSYEYDAASRLVRARLSTGHDVSVEYNPIGLVARVRDSVGTALAYQYNPQGLATTVTDQAGLATTMAYDASGLLTELVDPMGHARRMSYSPGGDLAQVTEANGDGVRLEYDAAGNLAAVHHPAGGVTRFVRNALDQAVEMENPLGARSQFVYDMAGRLTRAVNADGEVTAYSYNQAGRLAQKRLPDGIVVNYTYDAAGQLVAVDDSMFPVRYAYDSAGRRTRIEYPAIRKFVGYEYDASGQLAKFIAPDGSQVRYGYDDNKRVTSMTLADGHVIRFGFDAKGRLTSMQYPNGVSGAWDWDASGHLMRVSYRNAAGQEIDGCRYSYDNAGRPVRAVTWDGQTTEYRHDAAGQLLEESSAAGAIRYAYAPGGNRVRREAEGKATVYKHNAADQMVEAGDETIAYDTRGNVTERSGSAGVTRYAWDAENRLVRVQRADGGEVSYGYTATGSRAWRKDARGKTYFVSDGVNLLADVDEAMSPVATYIHVPGVDRPVAALRGGQLYCYHARSLGTISSITDGAGKVVARYRTDAFGNLTASTGTVANRLIFTAREYDADVGLYYHRARTYDPGLGRFLSADPDWRSFTDPIGVNRYAYVLNSPVQYSDPTGARVLPDAEIFGQFGLTPDMIRTIIGDRMTRLGESADLAGKMFELNLVKMGQERKGNELFQSMMQDIQSAESAQSAPVEDDFAARMDAEQRARAEARARSQMEGPQQPQPEAPRPAAAQAPREPGAPRGGPLERQGDPRGNVDEARLAASKRAPRDMPAASPERPANQPQGPEPGPRPGGEPAPAPGPVPQQARTLQTRARVAIKPPPGRDTYIDVSAEGAGAAGLGAAAAGTGVWADWEEGKDLGQAVKDEAWSALKWGGGMTLVALTFPATGPVIAALGAGAATYGVIKNTYRITMARSERPAREAEARRAQQIEVNAALIDEIMGEMEAMVTSEEAALDAIEDRYFKASPGFGAIQVDLRDATSAKKALDALSTSVHTASLRAGEAAEIKANIDAAVAGMKSDQETVNKGLEVVRALAERCASEDDANQAETMLRSCDRLTANLAQRADLARGEAAKLGAIKNDAEQGVRDMARVEKLQAQIASAADRAARTQASYADVKADRERIVSEYKERGAALQARLTRLRAQLPAVLPSGPPPKDYQVRYDKLVERAKGPYGLAGINPSDQGITPEAATEAGNQVVQIKLDADGTVAQMQTDAASLANVPSQEDATRSIDEAASVTAGSDDLAAKIAACRERLKGGPAQTPGAETPPDQQAGPKPTPAEGTDASGAPAPGGFQEVGEATGKGTEPEKADLGDKKQDGFKEVEETTGKDTSGAQPTPGAGPGAGPGGSSGGQPLQVGQAASIAAGQPAAYHIFAAGSRLGWAGGLARYSEGPSDQSIIDHLVTAGEHVMWANRESYPPTPAWPSWQQIKAQFLSWANNLVRYRNDQTRRSLAGTVTSSAESLAEQISVQTVGTTQQRPNCDAAYMRLGFHMAYAQQTLGIAAEAAGGGNSELVTRARQDATAHIQQVIQILMDYQGIHSASGVCADLSGIKEMEQAIFQVRDLATQYSTAMAAWKTALERIQSLARTGSSQPGDYEACLKKYCPMCQQTLSLIGVDYGPECQECKTRNQKLIADCVGGTSTPSLPARVPAARAPVAAPRSTPLDPGELEGTWFECDATGIVNWRNQNDPTGAQVLAKCMQTRRSAGLPGSSWTPHSDFKVRFSKSGNGYSGAVVGERLASSRDVGITSTGMADPRYKPGMEMFRLTKTGPNSYEGQIQWFSVNGGEDIFRLGNTRIVVEGDVATEVGAPRGEARPVKWVRCTPSNQ